MIEVDGSYGVGGGQILRIALLLSAITGQPFRLVNFLRGRQYPQHFPPYKSTIDAMAQICAARVENNHPASKKFTFEPMSKVTSGNYAFNVHADGSNTTLAQILAIALSYGEGASEVVFRGPTHGKNFPTPEYIREVFAKNMAGFGFVSEFELISPWFTGLNEPYRTVPLSRPTLKFRTVPRVDYKTVAWAKRQPLTY